MRVSGLLENLSSTTIINRLSWSQPIRPYRVWIINDTDKTNNLKPFGVTAKCLVDLKRKVCQGMNQGRDAGRLEDNEITLMRMADGTSIIDDEYLWQIPCTDDLVLLLPGQVWTRPEQFVASHPEGEEPPANSSLVKRKTTESCCSDNTYPDHRYFVPTPRGEVARLTLDIYRENPADAGSVRLTAATAGDAGLTVSYELRLNGAKAIIQYALRWTAVVLTYIGKLMVETGEILKRRFN